MRRLLLSLALLAGLVVSAATGGIALYRRPGPLPVSRDVTVPRGGLDRVAAALRRAGVLDGTLPFLVAARVTRGQGPIRAAEFRFPARASVADVLAILRAGRPVEHALTIPEGWTAAEIARALADDGALAGPVAVPPEGAALPQTYDFERGTTRAALLARMERAMTDAVRAVWAGRASATAPLTDPAALVILASLVEHETHLAPERPIVAAVFLNRLRIGMRLQSDATVAYAASGGLGPLGRALTRADLDWPTPYNTYLRRGLPPGPIGAPGLASLEAAAHPADTAALYFVATGLGGHVFADTLAAQDRNVAALRRREAASARPVP